MNKIKTAFMNMSWLMASQIITSILAFIWTIMIARYLGVSDYGIFGFAVSLSTMFAILGEVGISSHIVRSIATDNNQASCYLGNAIPLKIGLSIVYFVVIFLALSLMGQSKLVVYITLLYAIETTFKSFTSLFNGAVQAFEKQKYMAFSNILLAILSFILILIAIYFNMGLNGITWAYVLANMITLIYTASVLLRHITIPKIQFNFRLWKKLLIWGFPFALTSIFYTVYYSIDIVMLTQMVGDFATGIYNATYKLINVLTLFYTIYTAVFFPIMCKQYKEGTSSVTLSFEKSSKYLSMITIPIGVACLFYSTDVIQFIYGHQYDQAGVVLQILIWTVCFLFINGAASTALNASHREYSVTKIYLVAAIFNVVLNLFLIPKYSFIGASIATVLSEIVILILALITLNKIGIKPSKSLMLDIGKIILSAAILGIILYFLHLNMWIAIPVSIVIYLILLIVMKTFDDDDKYVVKQIIGK